MESFVPGGLFSFSEIINILDPGGKKDEKGSDILKKLLLLLGPI